MFLKHEHFSVCIFGCRASQPFPPKGLIVQCHHLSIGLSSLLRDGGVSSDRGKKKGGFLGVNFHTLICVVGQLAGETGSTQAALTTLCSGSPGDLSKKKKIACHSHFYSTDLSAALKQPIGTCSLGTFLHWTSVGTLHAWGTLELLPLLFLAK